MISKRLLYYNAILFFTRRVNDGPGYLWQRIQVGLVNTLKFKYFIVTLNRSVYSDGNIFARYVTLALTNPNDVVHNTDVMRDKYAVSLQVHSLRTWEQIVSYFTKHDNDLIYVQQNRQIDNMPGNSTDKAIVANIKTPVGDILLSIYQSILDRNRVKTAQFSRFQIDEILNTTKRKLVLIEIVDQNWGFLSSSMSYTVI